MSEKVAIIMRGLPGSGKSHWVENLHSFPSFRKSHWRAATWRIFDR